MLASLCTRRLGVRSVWSPQPISSVSSSVSAAPRRVAQHRQHAMMTTAPADTRALLSASTRTTRSVEAVWGESMPPLASVGLTEDQKAMQSLALQFAKDKFEPHVAEWDRDEIFPVEAMREAAQLGFGGIYVSGEYGGSELSRLDCSIILEALSSSDVSTSAYISIHNMVAGMIDRYGTPEQKKAYLPGLCDMSLFASYCLTEPGAGSDAAALATKAVVDGDDYVLNGSKAFISGAGSTDVYLVMVRTGEDGPRGISSVLVPKDAPGLSFGAKEKKLGWCTQPTRALIFEDCRIPRSNLLGNEGDGFKIAMQGLDGGRINIAACSLGGAQSSIGHAVEHLNVRKAFGKTLAAQQSLQFKLAEMATKVHASRLMVRSAASMIDEGHSLATPHAAMAKLLACDECYDVVDQALQLFGGYGYLKDYPLERHLRDMRVHRILEGTDNVMRIVISRAILQA